MPKLPNIFKNQDIVISQGLHIQSWNDEFYNVAIDFAYIDNLVCPFDSCEIVTYSNSFPENIRQSYFGLKLPDGNVILVVHAKPVKMGKINKGEPFAWCTWHHYHLAMLINGKPECILEYLDRSVRLSTQSLLYGGNSNHPDSHWENYADKKLNIQIQPQPAPQPPTVQLGNDKMFRLSKGGWRSQVIQELIDAKIWQGTWQSNEQRFFELNGTVTPEGGWKAGDHVKYDSVIVATTPIIPESTQDESPVTPHPLIPEITPIVDDNPRMVYFPPTPVESTGDGRILGISKKLTSAITAGMSYFAILNSLPPEVLARDIGGLPLSIWVGTIIALLNGIYITVQGIIDYKSNT